MRHQLVGGVWGPLAISLAKLIASGEKDQASLLIPHFSPPRS